MVTVEVDFHVPDLVVEGGVDHEHDIHPRLGGDRVLPKFDDFTAVFGPVGPVGDERERLTVIGHIKRVVLSESFGVGRVGIGFPLEAGPRAGRGRGQGKFVTPGEVIRPALLQATALADVVAPAGRAANLGAFIGRRFVHAPDGPAIGIGGWQNGAGAGTVALRAFKVKVVKHLRPERRRALPHEFSEGGNRYEEKTQSESPTAMWRTEGHRHGEVGLRHGDRGGVGEGALDDPASAVAGRGHGLTVNAHAGRIGRGGQFEVGGNTGGQRQVEREAVGVVPGHEERAVTRWNFAGRLRE